MNGRVTSLLTIIESLQTQLESSSSLLRLKALWEKVISAHSSLLPGKDPEHPITSDDTNTALAMLSAIFVKEISQPDAENGKSLIQHLLQKVSEMEHLMTGDSRKFHEANDDLRMKLQQKSAKLHDTSIQLHDYKKQNRAQQEELERLQSYCRNLEGKVDLLSEENRSSKQRIAQLQESVIQSQNNQADLHKEYQDIVQIADQWKATCQQYEQTLVSYRLSSGKSSHGSPSSPPIYSPRSSPKARTENIPAPTPQISSPRYFSHLLDAQEHAEYETPYRRAYELYSPDNSPMNISLSHKHHEVLADDIMNLPEPAVSYHHDEEDIRLPEHSISPKTPAIAHSSARPQITPSPMTDHSYVSTIPAASQTRIPLKSTPTNTRRHRHNSPAGYISSATKKSVERRSTHRPSPQPQSRLVDNRYKNEDEIIEGSIDMSMDSSMNRDITAAVAMISAMMPWD
jgi:hypothetical protein